MSMMTKFLALMPLVVVGAACGGVSPVSPESPLAADSGSASPGMTAASKSADAFSTSTAECRGVTGVALAILPATMFTGVVVEAKYLGDAPSVSSCPAPSWTSNPRQVLTPQLNGFRVGVSSPTLVIVTASTLNGRRGQIRVQP